MATKAANIAALVAGGFGSDADYAGMKAAAVQKLRDTFAPEKSGPSADDIAADLKASAIDALVKAGMGTADDYAAMPETVLIKLAANLTDTGKGKGKSADLPKEPKVTLPKVRMALDTDAPRVTRVLDAMRHLKAGTFNLPKLVGNDRNGQPKTGTWQPNTVFNVVLENLADVGVSDTDAKVWAELASMGKVDAAKLTDAFKLPTHADRKGKVRA